VIAWRAGVRTEEMERDPRELVPRPAARGAASLFRRLSALRGKRVAHPHGRVFEATFDPYVGGTTGTELLDGGTRRALVRCSRALGLPEPLPDVLGFAIRFPDAYGPGRHHDFLCVTSIDAPVAHHVLVPATGFFARPYSSLLAYRVADDVRLVGVLPAGSGPAVGPRLAQITEAVRRGTASFELALAPLSGRFGRVGTIRLDAELTTPDAERMRFNPWNCGGGIRPTGPLMGIRDAAYSGSQQGSAT
jgi:hypothetical protein